MGTTAGQSSGGEIMSYIVPPTQERIDANVARIESAIGQKVPQTQQAFARIVAVIQGMSATGIQKYAAERAKQALVISADLEQLKYLGGQFGVAYKYATAAEITAGITGTAGTVITSDNYWVGDANGVRYESETDVTISESYTTQIPLIAVDTGTVGDLQYGDTLSIGNAVAGYTDAAFVVSLDVDGVDDEETEDYRSRILNVLRSKGGGGNSADYRRWAEETPLVTHAYPYAGRPYYDMSGELITNGTFNTNIDGWTDSSILNGAISWSAGTMKLETAPA